MLEEVDGKFRFVVASSSFLQPFLAPPPQKDKRTGGLELGLHPELSVRVVIGNVDPQTAIFAENDESSAMFGGLLAVCVCVCE